MKLLLPTLALPLLLSSCGSPISQTAAPAASSQSADIEGRTHGGLQPVGNAHVYLFAANNIGYRAPSISLIKPSAPTTATDSRGTYFLTDATGGFRLNHTNYSCSSGQLLYLLSTTGNPGLAGESNNDAISLIFVLGPCPSDGNIGEITPFININEVSTVTGIYALAGFMSDITHVSSAPTQASQQGLANAFATVNNLFDVTTSQALSQNLQGNGVIPQAKINALANLIVPCVNSTGSSNPCSTLFSNARDSNGFAPTDTATAVLNIAHNPAANSAALFALIGSTPIYQPTLTTAPNDWTLALTFFADNMAGPYFPAIDSGGNLWVPAYASNTLTKFDPLGNILSNQSGFTGGGLNQPFSVAIDSSDNPWIVNFAPLGASTISRFSSFGTPITSTPYPCGLACFFLAFDSAQNAWISGASRTLTLSSSGATVAQFPMNAYDSGIAIDSTGHAWTLGLNRALYRLSPPSSASQFTESATSATASNELTPVAIDSSDNVWFVGNKSNALGESDKTGKPISPTGGYTGGGLSAPSGIAIDGANRVWIANRNNNSISAFSSAGAPITPATGYTADSISGPRGIAIDGSGNIWITNFTYNSVTEFIGLATPSATPITPTN
ncbi:MAG TPA: NHL repeat-containing protein, partial [Edaphobacter sp.]